MTLLDTLAAQVRALPDAQLVEIAAPWIAETLAAASGGSTMREIDESLERVTKRPRAKRGGAPVAKPRRTSKGVVAVRRPIAERGGVGDEGERVFAVLAASPDAMKLAEVAAALGKTPSATGSALQALKRAGRAFSAGHSIFSRWAIAQEIADEAVAALRGEA